jgi:hypothetical protein
LHYQDEFAGFVADQLVQTGEVEMGGIFDAAAEARFALAASNM